MTLERKFTWTRVNNDVNGNPRYVVHFRVFMTKEEWMKGDILEMYETAVNRAKRIKGRRYHNKKYGGGIVFCTYEPREVEEEILDLVEQYKRTLK